MIGTVGAKSNDPDDLLKLVKDAFVIIDIYRGDLGRIAFHSKDRINRGIAADGRAVATWWIARAERVLGLSSSDLLIKCLSASSHGTGDAETTPDEQVRQILDLYIRGDHEVRARVIAVVEAMIEENRRLRRRIKTFQERSKKAKLAAERARFVGKE